MMFTKTELLAMLAMMLGVIMDGMDSSIINIAVPVIAESFGTDTNSIAWVTIVYFIMIAGLMLAFGRIADTGHIRKIYILGFAVFAIGSLMCGLSDNLAFMIISRVIQGSGAAMLAAVAPMICVKFLPSNKLGLGLALLGIGGSVGFGIGPTIGGFIIELASWHWAFFINIPIGIIGILIAMRGLPKDLSNGKANLDVPGTMFIFTAVLCGVLALELFSYDGYGTICIVLAAVMMVLLVAFVMTEKRVKHPMLNLRMFRDWKFVSISLCYLIVNLSYMGIFYIVPFYMTKAVGMDTLSAGLALLIPGAITGVLSLPVGRYCDQCGKRRMTILATVFLILTFVGYAVVNPQYGWLSLVPPFILAGIMWGIATPSICSRLVSIAHDKDKAMASTMSNFIYYVGGSVGTALFASLLTFGAGSAGIPVEQMSVDSFMQGYGFVTIVAIAMSFLALISAWIVNEERKSKT